MFGPLDHFGLGRFDAQSIKEPRVHQGSGAGIGLIACENRIGLITIGDHADHRQAILAGKIDVALVMRWATEHRAGAIVHQHKIGDVEWQLDCVVKRVLQPQAGIEAELFLRFDLRRCRPTLAALLDEGGDGGVTGQALRNRMLRCNRDKAGAKDRVGPGGEHLNLGRTICAVEFELQALRFADPVFLHQPDLFRPLVEAAQTIEQFIGELGDFQEPLAELALFDQCAAAPAAPVNHLLVGQHGHIDRVPVDRRFLAVDETRRIEIEEQRLFVAVIVRLAS